MTHPGEGVPAGEVMYLLRKLCTCWGSQCTCWGGDVLPEQVQALPGWLQVLPEQVQALPGWLQALPEQIHQGGDTSTFLRRFKMYTLVWSYLLEFLESVHVLGDWEILDFLLSYRQKTLLNLLM